MAGLANIPSITTSNTTASYYDGTGNAMGLVNTTNTAGIGHYPTQAFGIRGFRPVDKTDEWERRIAEAEKALAQQAQHDQSKVNSMAKAARRLVKVVIVDTDENVPLDKCVLYSGEEKMTDATDQELFFEIDIKNILDKHNEYRVTLKDKSIKERVENLEPVKIRDLRMVVVNVASF